MLRLRSLTLLRTTLLIRPQKEMTSFKSLGTKSWNRARKINNSLNHNNLNNQITSAASHNSPSSIKILTGTSMTRRRLSRSRDGRGDAKKSSGLTLFSILGMPFVDVNFLHRLPTAFSNVIIILLNRLNRDVWQSKAIELAKSITRVVIAVFLEEVSHISKWSRSFPNHFSDSFERVVRSLHSRNWWRGLWVPWEAIDNCDNLHNVPICDQGGVEWISVFFENERELPSNRLSWWWWVKLFRAKNSQIQLSINK